MSRLPFDPSKMAAARKPESAPAPADAVLSVSALADRIDAALRDRFTARVRVTGEISNFKERTHWYFDLKDAAAVVSCVMFAAPARKVAASGWTPQAGQAVVITGRVEFYAKGGKVSFIVEKIEPAGAGALDLAFKKLCDDLRQLGYFDPVRKRPLPTFPRRVAVVTSRTGAALQDVLVTMKRRCPAVGVLIVDVRVQGDGAAAEIAAAIRHLSANHETLGVDAILVTRGGGSKEDLWAFNERPVADAVYQCSIPVVAAIGHETDVTIAELVADERCATPTQAAMRLTPDVRDLERHVDSAHRRLSAVLDRNLRLQRQRLASLARHPVLADPHTAVRLAGDRLAERTRRLTSALRLLAQRCAGRLAQTAGKLERARPTAVHARLSTRADAAGTRLARALAQLIARRRDKLAAADRQLQAVGPQHVLDRGFSITTLPDGTVLRSASHATPGHGILTRLADGTLRSTVDGSSPTPPTPPKAAKPVKSPPRKPPPQPGSLFD